MMKHKVKPSRQEQEQIANEAATTEQRRLLKRQIATLRRLPDDFRDILPGSNDWESFATITKRRREMEDWDNGPIFILQPLNTLETGCLGSPNVLTPIKTTTETSMRLGKFGVHAFLASTPCAYFSADNWYSIVTLAEQNKISWIYLPDEEAPVIAALNVVLSRFGYNVRVKGQLLSERTGKPIGIVH